MIEEPEQGHQFLGPLGQRLFIHAAHHGRVSLATSCFESGLQCGVICVRVQALLIEIAYSGS